MNHGLGSYYTLHYRADSAQKYKFVGSTANRRTLRASFLWQIVGQLLFYKCDEFWCVILKSILYIEVDDFSCVLSSRMLLNSFCVHLFKGKYDICPIKQCDGTESAVITTALFFTDAG